MAAERPLQPAPLPRRPSRAGGLMWRVVIALIPAGVLGVAAYGPGALALAAASVTGALAGEAAGRLLWRQGRLLADGSAVLSGLLLSLTLPPGLGPGWAALGGFLGVLAGRQLFGGLGMNLINPALAGRLALSLLVPDSLAAAYRAPFTWQGPGWWSGALPAADPLPAVRETGRVLRSLLEGAAPAPPPGWPAGERLDLIRHAQETLAAIGPEQLLWPRLPGLLGEASLLALLPGLLWLFAARLVDWRIPAAALLALVPVLLWVAGGAAGQELTAVLFLKGSGLLLLVCVLASDPVTTPLGQLGKFAYGLLVAAGAMAVLGLGGPAGGLFLVVLAAGLATPWLDRLLLPGGPR